MSNWYFNQIYSVADIVSSGYKMTKKKHSFIQTISIVFCVDSVEYAEVKSRQITRKRHIEKAREKKAIECNDMGSFQAEYKLQRTSIGIRVH